MKFTAEFHCDGVTFTIDEDKVVIIDPENKLRTGKGLGYLMNSLGVFFVTSINWCTAQSDVLPESEHDAFLETLHPPPNTSTSRS